MVGPGDEIVLRIQLVPCVLHHRSVCDDGGRIGKLDFQDAGSHTPIGLGEQEQHEKDCDDDDKCAEQCGPGSLAAGSGFGRT